MVTQSERKGNKPIADAETVRKAVETIIPSGQVTELRALEATTQGQRGWPCTISGYFDDARKLAEAAETITSAKGVYIVPNPVEPSLLARAANRIRPTPRGESTGDQHITGRRWLLVDCDAVRASGISSTQWEHQAALQRAETIADYLHHELGFPSPISADSGNGAHLMYRIDLPADDGGLVERCLQALAQHVDDNAVTVDTTVHNPARIWKLYGALTCKGDDTADRPHRRAKLLDVPSQLEPVPRAKLEELAAMVAEPETEQPYRGNGHVGNHKLDVAQWLEDRGVSYQTKDKGSQGRAVYIIDCPFNPEHKAEANITQEPSGKLGASCFHNSCSGKGWQEFKAAIGEPDPEHYDPPLGRRQTHKGQSGPQEQSTKPAEPTARYQPYPVQALPQPARRYVQTASAAIGCDPAYIALPLLACIASAIGNSRQIRLKDGWTEPAILWTAIIGDSGTQKSPAQESATRPIYFRQAELVREHEQELRQYEQMQELYKADLQQWRRTGRKQGEPPPDPPDKPTCRRLVVSDTTMEALAGRLAENPRGLLLARDELAGWLGSFDQYKGGKARSDVAHWLSLHHGRDLIVDRKSGDPPTLCIRRASVSVTGSIQPITLQRALGREHFEDGLAARLLFAFPPKRKKHWSETEIREADQRALANLYARLLDLEPDHDDRGDPMPETLGLTPDAKRRWIDWYEHHAEEEAEATGDLAAALAKLEAAAARLALIVHLTRSAGGEPVGDHIDLDSLQAAISLTEWHKAETARVYRMLAETDEDRERRELIELVERKGGRISPRELYRASRQYQPTDVAEGALQELVNAGIGTWENSPTATNQRREFVLSTPLTLTNLLDSRLSGEFVNVNGVNGAENEHRERIVL